MKQKKKTIVNIEGNEIKWTPIDIVYKISLHDYNNNPTHGSNSWNCTFFSIAVGDGVQFDKQSLYIERDTSIRQA